MKHYDIPHAAEYMGFSVPYLRTLIRRGTIKTTRQPVHEGTSVTKHMIAESELKRFMKDAPHKSKRSDGRNKYVLYARTDEVVIARMALLNAGLSEVAALLMPANKMKGNGDDQDL